MRLLLLLLLAGCTPKSAAAVSDRFVDLYFVEIDQKRALELCTGLARSKIEEELSLVAQIRRKLGDDPARPTFIATEPGTGYRLLA